MAPRNATTTSRGRTYSWHGETYWSVTTILSAGLPKPALVPWAAKAVAEYAVAHIDQVQAIADTDPDGAIALLKGSPYRDRERAADLGSLIHARIEALILGQPLPPAPPVAMGYLDAFDAFTADFAPEFLAAEMSVYNRTAQYAGTLDWIARLPGLGTVLGDVKTGKAIWPDVAQQLVAYRRAEFVGMPDGTEAPMPATDAAAALHLRADGTYALLPVRTDEEVWQAFLYTARQFAWIESISKTVLGEPLVPAEREAVA